MKTLSIGERLIQGLFSKELSEVCSGLLKLPPGALAPEDADIVRQAHRTLETIQRESDLEKQEVAEALAAEGVTVSVRKSSSQKQDTTYHVFQIHILPRDLSTAFRIFHAGGFICPVRIGHAEFEIFRKFYSTVTLVRPDDVSLRMRVTWQKAITTNKLARLLRPSLKDSQVLDLPAGLWPLYYLIRPVRIAANFVSGSVQEKMAPFMGTPISVVKPILEFAGVKEDDVLVDLGCGDGRVVIETARLTGCRTVGIELDIALVDLARKNVAESDVDKRIQILHSNATEFQLNGATVIFLFLPVETVQKLIPDLLQRLKPGTRIISHEQQTPIHPVQPIRSQLILSENAMTVAHMWEV